MRFSRVSNLYTKTFLPLYPITCIQVPKGGTFKDYIIILFALSDQSMVGLKSSNNMWIKKWRKMMHFHVKEEFFFVLAKGAANVIIRAHNSIVSSTSHRSLKEGIHRTFPSSNVLLIIGHIKCKSSPSIFWSLLLLIHLRHNFKNLWCGATIAWITDLQNPAVEFWAMWHSLFGSAA